jgi:hypothetical protein
MRVTRALAVIPLLAGMAPRAAAQGPGPVRWPAPVSARAPARLGLVAAPPHALPADSSAIIPTYWALGGVIGATAIGGSLAGLILAGCDRDAGIMGSCGLDALVAAFLGGTIGFIVGALVGGAIPQSSP